MGSIEKPRLNERTSSSSGQSRTAAWCLVWVLGLVVTAGVVHGQSPAPAAEPAPAKPDAATPPDNAAKPESPGNVADRASSASEAKTQVPAAKPGGCGDKASAGSSAFGQDAAAKWACAQPTVTLGPVWDGDPLVYTFEIRNEGTAALKIHASGG